MNKSVEKIPPNQFLLTAEDYASAEDEECMSLELKGFSKYKFLQLVRGRSLKCLQEITESINIQIPTDLDFSEMDVKLSKSRWIMEMLVVISLTLVNLQWFQYTIVSHTIVSYYDTSAVLVNWTSLIYMLCYVLFTFPVSYILDNRIVNLRVAMITANTLLLFGSGLKLISVDFISFELAFGGQVLVALAQVIILNIPSTLAFEWFAAKEKTTICNLSIFGMQLGMLLGFAITPIVVENHDEDLDAIAEDLNNLNYLHVALSFTSLFLVLGIFRAKPEFPPCFLQAIQERSRCQKHVFWKTFKILIRSSDFNLLNISYSLQLGAVNTIFTLLSPLILHYLPEADKTAGLVGVTIITAGLIASLTMTAVLHRQKELQFMAIFTEAFAAIFVIIFIISLQIQSETLLFVAAACIGLFMTSFQTIGYEFAFELTFPESDGTVGGVINVSTQLMSILITTIVTNVNSTAGYLTGNLILIGALLLGICAICFAKCELRRRNSYQIIDNTAKQLKSTREQTTEATPLLAVIYWPELEYTVM